MGSSEKYWRLSRDCAEYARETKNPEEREVLERMAEAWARIAMVDDDVAKQADQELIRTLH